jgi:hypothetical protein
MRVVHLLAFPWPSLFVSFVMVLPLIFYWIFLLRIDVKQDVEIEGWKSIILTHMLEE